MFCNNYVIEGDTLYMLESVGPVSAAAADIECPMAPDPAGWLLRTRTRPRTVHILLLLCAYV